MRAHQWIVTLGLLALVLAAAVGLILTRQSAQSNPSLRSRRPPIVDEQPLTTARALAALASDWDEQRFSRQTLKLADHSVDVAFSYEMRQATEHPAPPTPESKKLFAQANHAQAAVTKTRHVSTDYKSKWPSKKTGANETLCSSGSI